MKFRLLLGFSFLAGALHAQIVPGYGILPVNRGGTGKPTATAYSVLLSGTTATAAFKFDLGTGTSGQVLTSNGAGAYPSWQDASGGSGSGDVSAATNFGTDNVLIRSNGTTKGVQATGISVDDSNNITGIVDMTITGALAPGSITWGSTVVPVANGGTGIASGTSGGVLAYTASGTLASSGALTANALIKGGGAGVAPSSVTTGTGVLTALGVNTGSAGAFQVNNASGSGLTALTAANITAGALADGMTVTTQSPATNTTRAASGAYADAAAKAGMVGTYASPDTTGGAVTLTQAVTEVWTNTTTTYTIPAVASSAGKAIIFYVVGTNAITIDVNASEIFVRDGTAQTGGVTLTLTGAAGNYVCLICDGTRWVTLGFKGALAAGS